MRLKDREAAVEAAKSSILANAPKVVTWGDAADWYVKEFGDEATFGPSAKMQFEIKADDSTKTVQLVLAVDDSYGQDGILDVMPMDEPVEGAAEDEIEEEKMEGEDEDEDSKSAKKARVMTAKIRDAGGSKSIERSGRLARQKAYDKAAQNGTKIHLPDHTRKHAPVFGSYDEQEQFAAQMRLDIMGGYNRDYAAKSHDLAVVGKAMSETRQELGGAWNAPEFEASLIELKNSYGAVRQAGGVVSMANDTKIVPRLDEDIVVSGWQEGQAGTEDEVGTGSVRLVAGKVGALVKVSNELFTDSSVPVGDAVARSTARAYGRWEDLAYLKGDKPETAGEGITDKLGANSTHDAALSSGWGDLAITDINEFLGKLPAWAWEHDVTIIGSIHWHWQTLRRFGYSAGGLQPQMVLGGNVGPTDVWDGIRFIPTPAMPGSYSANQIVAVAGAFGAATKLGEVTGSDQLSFSEHRYFDTDQVAWRASRRLAWSSHDVNNDTDADGNPNSGVVGLQD